MRSREQIHALVKQYWMEHDGTNFYQDELNELIDSIRLQDERDLLQEVVKKVVGMKKEARGGRSEFAGKESHLCRWCGVGELELHKGDCPVLEAHYYNQALDDLATRLRNRLASLDEALSAIAKP